MTAREALRKARATRACDDAGHCGPCVAKCAAVDFKTDMSEDNPWAWHVTAGSILLDGFSVEEVTNAGG